MIEKAAKIYVITQIIGGLLAVSFLLVLLAASCTAEAGVRKDIWTQAVKKNFDPALALAVAKVESNFDVNAVGALGEVGVFQLRPNFHGPAIYDPKSNISIAIDYLKKLKKICPYKDEKSFVICYNKGPYRKFKQKASKDGYFSKVMKEYEKIRTQELSNKLAQKR